MVIDKRKNIFQATDAAGRGSVLVGGESTHYVRVIAVFKTSLSLCVTHLSCFWTDGDGGSQEEGGED